MTEHGFFESLERQLGVGFDHTVNRRAHRRRIVERVGGGAFGVVALLAAIVLVTGEEGAAAGVEAETRNGLVYVRLVDIEYDADAIEAAAAREGLDITVEAVPASPSLVGRFVSATTEGEEPGRLEELGRDGPAFSGFAMPASYGGSLVISVGRPARRGEVYLHFGNALSEGESMACSGIAGASPTRALEIVEQRGVDAVWTAYAGRGGFQQIDPTELDNAQFGDLRVQRAVSIAPGRVQIALSDGETPLPPFEQTADATC